MVSEALNTCSCKTLCPACSDCIVAEIKVRQRWALRQHSCKHLFILSLHFTAAQLEFLMRQAVINVSCLRTSFSAAMPLRASPKKLMIKRKTAGKRILPTTPLTLLDVLLSIIVLPAARVLHLTTDVRRDGSQSGQQRGFASS